MADSGCGSPCDAKRRDQIGSRSTATRHPGKIRSLVYGTLTSITIPTTSHACCRRSLATHLDQVVLPRLGRVGERLRAERAAAEVGGAERRFVRVAAVDALALVGRCSLSTCTSIAWSHWRHDVSSRQSFQKCMSSFSGEARVVQPALARTGRPRTRPRPPRPPPPPPAARPSPPPTPAPAAAPGAASAASDARAARAVALDAGGGATRRRRAGATEPERDGAPKVGIASSSAAINASYQTGFLARLHPRPQDALHRGRSARSGYAARATSVTSRAPPGRDGRARP